MLLNDIVAQSDPAIRRGVADAAAVLAGAGIAIEQRPALAAIEAIDRHAMIVMQGESARAHRARIDDAAIAPVLRRRLAKGLEIADATLAESVAARQRLVHDFEEQVLAGNDVAVLPVMAILTPSAAECDPASERFSPRTLYALSRFTRFVNMLGFPAIALPAGFDDRGLPIGVQIVGRAGCDLALFELVRHVQSKTDWHARIPTAIAHLVPEPELHIMTRPIASSALSHLRVLDLTRVRAGPTCCRILADFGADVIKIEAPPGVDPNEGISGARHGYDMINLHRNKRSMTLNLKESEGRAAFMRMVETADIVVENFRPDVKDRLGIGYEQLKAVNPRIILASISGFGQSGPYKTRAGFDQIAQGMGGLMGVTGEPGTPPMRAGIAVADSSAGVFAATGILIALGRARAVGPGTVGRDLAAAGPDRDDGFPGRALSRRGHGAAAGRQRSSDQHADGRRRDRRRLHQHRCRRGRPVALVLRGDRPPRSCQPSRLRQGRRAVPATGRRSRRCWDRSSPRASPPTG